MTSLKPIYILGTGLSHNGSACLLKDGKIIVAIEKERLSRKKHDGGNDNLAIQYCLDAAGITINDLSLVVQAANFEKETIKKSYYKGSRLFTEDTKIPFVTISHHLAHAYSAVGTSPFNTCNVLVIDGCGSPLQQCDDIDGAYIPADVNTVPGMYVEKDSYYHFDGKKLKPLYKDFSLVNISNNDIRLPVSQHSIGGFYSMVSNYCFGNMDDAGKLMGLAPYGFDNIYQQQIFKLQNGNVYVDENVLGFFDKPMDNETHALKDNFQYYANIAKWVQKETERAVLYVFNSRLKFNHHDNICYAGGVALNAVANAGVLKNSSIKNLYIEPAAGDNGLALGCAFYGWIEVLGKEKIMHNGTTLFGKTYMDDDIEEAIKKFSSLNPDISFNYIKADNYIEQVAEYLHTGKLVGWFQNGAEFGPRALGSRSILADPRIENVQHIINSEVKFREDFRPFAPAVLKANVNEYFEHGHESDYMILTDKIKPEWKNKLKGIVHVDGTCRVQTIQEKWNKPFHELVTAFKKLSAIGVLLNTSFNKKGMPIVETPFDAISFFYTCKLDVLVLNNYIISKA